MPRRPNSFMWLALVSLLLSGCVKQMAANMAYGDVSAAAVADKKECNQGDKVQCLKFQRAQDRCREMIARGDTSAATLVCQRMVEEGVISIDQK